jgi:hypothetical protein
MWEGFSAGYLNFELNRAGVYQTNVVLLIVVGFR